MQEKTLLRIALFGSIIGIILLYIISQFAQPEQKSIHELTNNDLGNKVLMGGKIKSVKSFGNTTLIEITRTENIKIMMFSELPYTLNTGENIEVIGTVKKYKDEYELIGEEIRIIG